MPQDNIRQVTEDIKWFMFDDESKEIKNEKRIFTRFTICNLVRRQSKFHCERF